MTLTIYSNNFDDYSYVVNHGMNGKVFLEADGQGKEFKNAAQALEYVVLNGLSLDKMTLCWQRNGQQFFKSFKVSESD